MDSNVIYLLISGCMLLGSYEGTMASQNLRVVTVLHPPYSYFKDGAYSGLVPDILDEVTALMNVSYTLRHIDAYGQPTPNSTKWSGLIGELQQGRADLVGAALTMTSAREQVVNFVTPFQDVGITILIKKGSLDQSGLAWPYDFSIFDPMDASVWIIIAATTLIISVVIYSINRLHPAEWGNFQTASGRISEEQGDTFNLPGSFWFIMTSLTWQGYERSPRSLAGKVVVVFWFMFVMVTLISYTASFSAHLVWASGPHRQDRPAIRSLGHLVQSGWKYGAVANATTYDYLMRVAKGWEYDLLREYFSSDEGQKQLVSSTAEGVALVRQGNYAFIMESMTALHQTNQLPCDVMTTGPIFAKRSYGMAVQHGSPWLETLQQHFLTLHELGVIERLEEKWFIDSGACHVQRQTGKYFSMAPEDSKPKRINVKMFLGPVAIIIVGVVLAGLVAIAEIVFLRKFDTTGGRAGRKLEEDNMT